MTGTAAARGRHTVHAATLAGILRGWLIGPGAGIALAYTITRLVPRCTLRVPLDDPRDRASGFDAARVEHSRRVARPAAWSPGIFTGSREGG